MAKRPGGRVEGNVGGLMAGLRDNSLLDDGEL